MEMSAAELIKVASANNDRKINEEWLYRTSLFIVHTIWGVSQLSADHTGVSVVPEVITDGAPSATDTYFYSPIPVPTCL